MTSRPSSGRGPERNLPPLDDTFPDAIFDPQWYRQHHPDVSRSGVDPWAHYVHHGDGEWRRPGPGFDPEFYRSCYLPPDATRPGYHYIRVGRPLGHLPVPLPRDDADSRRAMRRALSAGRFPIVLVGHDAQRTGAPLLLLEVALALRLRGFTPVVILKRSGPLIRSYRSIGPTLIVDEGWSLDGFAEALTAGVPVVGSTGWSAPIITALAPEGPSAVLVHEMPAYLREHDLVGSLATQQRVIASMPGTRLELAEDFRRVSDAKGVAGPRLSVQVPPLFTRMPSRAERARVRNRLAEVWGASPVVFIGAGYADHRKGFDLFLEAAAEISTLEPRARFVWLGELSPWAAERADAAMAAGLPLLLPGFRDDSPAWYAESAVYLLTSRQDPGPTTALDAAFVGTPFVGYAADIGLLSLGEVIDPAGVFVDAGDTSAYVDVALGLVHEASSARARRHRHLAAQRTVESYTAAVIEELSSGPGAPPRQPALRHQRLRSSAAWLRPVKHTLRFGPWQALVWASRATGWRADPESLMSVPVLGRLGPSRPRGQAGASRRPMSIAVVEDGLAVPASALRTLHDVADLEPGSRAWVADTDLLRHLGGPFSLHVLRRPRSPKAPAWGPVEQVVSELADSIVSLEQHSHHRAPRWARHGEAPPRARTTAGWVQGRWTSSELPSVSRVAPLERPIAVLIHAYHLDLVPALTSRLTSVTAAYRLYISTDTEHKAAWLRAHRPDALVRVLPNVGRDVYPKVYGWRDIRGEHDLELHLHTKRSPHSSALTDTWLTHILDALLADKGTVDGILDAFASRPLLGMVSPAPLPSVLPSYGWTINRPIAQALTWGRGWGPLPADRALAFPAGSMFWARTAALGPLRDLDLPPHAFSEHVPEDGSLAHALERLVGVSCTAAGYEQVLVQPRQRSAAPIRATAAASTPEWNGTAMTDAARRTTVDTSAPATGSSS